jgi:DNA-binding NtrC family response regulator
VALADDGVLHAGALYLPDEGRGAAAEGPASLNLEEVEEWAIRRALAQTAGNNTQAARLLGIHRDTLINKLRKYRIEKGGQAGHPV